MQTRADGLRARISAVRTRLGYALAANTRPAAIWLRLAALAFSIFLFVALGAHSDSMRRGPFAWLPLACLSPLSLGRCERPEAPVFGGVAVALLLWLAAWLLGRIFDARTGSPRRTASPRFSWGPKALTLPLAALTLWTAFALWGRPGAIEFKVAAAWPLFWLVYLYLINERPGLTAALALALLLQGSVALGQFMSQHDLGLRWLGERWLDATVGGFSVMLVDGERVLRAHGLTGGPNSLGATLVIVMLLLLPAAWRARGRRLFWVGIALIAGLLGLLASFSRSAWLALLISLLVWGVLLWRRGPRVWRRPTPLQAALALIPLVLAAGFLFGNREALIGRLARLDTPLEARSLSERRRDADLALDLIAAHPCRGVGPGGLQGAARAIDPAALVVHNVPLLVAAELGLVGAVLWLWLVLAGLWLARRSPWLAALWLAPIVVGLFAPWWVTVSWRAALLLALVAGKVAEGED